MKKRNDQNSRRGVRGKNQWENEARKMSKKAKKPQMAQLKKKIQSKAFEMFFLLSSVLWKTGRVNKKRGWSACGSLSFWFLVSLAGQQLEVELQKGFGIHFMLLTETGRGSDSCRSCAKKGRYDSHPMIRLMLYIHSQDHAGFRVIIDPKNTVSQLARP